MTPKLSPDTPSFATHYLRMIPFNEDSVLSTGTGFLYEYKNVYYLITNGHNITRMNPEQTLRITNSAAFPVKIRTKFRASVDEKVDVMTLLPPIDIKLYKDEEFQKPIWLVHPNSGYLVDVVAIPLFDSKELSKDVHLYPINKFKFDTQFGPRVADDVFILGYPFNITGGLELPVWKKGSIATEPNVPIDDLPKIFIDTATRSGMSGSPVIMRRTGIHGFDGRKIKGDDIIGTIENFIGIYSGRIGAENEFKAQLGVVWKKEVIDEILEAQQVGDIKFQLK